VNDASAAPTRRRRIIVRKANVPASRPAEDPHPLEALDDRPTPLSQRPTLPGHADDEEDQDLLAGLGPEGRARGARLRGVVPWIVGGLGVVFAIAVVKLVARPREAPVSVASASVAGSRVRETAPEIPPVPGGEETDPAPASPERAVQPADRPASAKALPVAHASWKPGARRDMDSLGAISAPDTWDPPPAAEPSRR
jgi:hypothetical protein